jgi:hypothetical protein
MSASAIHRNITFDTLLAGTLRHLVPRQIRLDVHDFRASLAKRVRAT